MSAGDVAEIEAVVNKAKEECPVTQTKAIVDKRCIVLSHPLSLMKNYFVPTEIMKSMKLCSEIVPGSRVMNLLDDGIVPFGAVGTVAIVENTALGIVFDNFFFMGSSPVAVYGLLVAVASFIVERGL